MPRLIFVDVRGRNAIELAPHNSIGRHPNNAIQLLDTIVSEEHCVVERQGGGVVLRDLGSMNGTFIQGERVQGIRMLRHGDEIRMGNTTLRYDDGHPGLSARRRTGVRRTSETAGQRRRGGEWPRSRHAN